MTAAVCDQRLTVFCAVVGNSYGARLFTALIATHQRIRRREESNLFVRSGKSEAEVTEDCARRILVLKLITDRHEASRGLSAIAELLVYFTYSLAYYYHNSIM